MLLVGCWEFLRAPLIATIVGREDNNIARNIKEAIFIRVNDPSLIRNIGKFQLPHIWDEVLARSPELHLNNAIISGMVVTLNPPTSQMVVTINPPTTFNANNIRQGGNHKSTY